MKIYRSITFDMKTGAVIAEDSYEYSGPVAECKGKGGSSSTTTSTTTINAEPDKEYNARMAAVAEQQQNLSGKFFDWWQDVQAPVEAATAAAQLGLLPTLTAIEQAEANARLQLVPEQAGLTLEQTRAARGLLPLQTALERAETNARLQLVPEQAGLTLEQTRAARELLPLQTGVAREQAGLTLEQAQAARGLLPLQTDIAREGLESFKGIQSDFYKASRPLSAEVYAGRAVADTNKSLSAAQDTLSRNQARMGVSPNSGAAQAAQRDLALAGAAARAGAANTGRLAGENINYERLKNAVTFGGK